MNRYPIFTILSFCFALLGPTVGQAQHRHNHGHSHSHGPGTATRGGPLADLLGAADFLAHSYSGDAAALRGLSLNREIANSRVVATVFVGAAGAAITTQTYHCPRTAQGVVTNCSNARARARNAVEAMANLGAALVAGVEELREAGGDPNQVNFMKAWPLRRGGHDLVWVRAELVSNDTTTQNVNFSCHKVDHGTRHGAEMHCHFVNGDALGPEEPVAAR